MVGPVMLAPQSKEFQQEAHGSAKGATSIALPIKGLTIFFPVYNDEGTVKRVTEKALVVAAAIGCPFEVIIVDDGSLDASGAIADEIAQGNPNIRVIHHPQNRGYGAALRTGLAASKHEWICMTDGDDQYDLRDIFKLLKVAHHYDVIITFRYRKIYSNTRILISAVYNTVLRLIFRTNFRDISTGLRLIRKSVIDDLKLESSSPFIGAEIAIKSMLKGYPVGEVGIQTFPRDFGNGSSTSFRNIMATIRDMIRVHRRLFSSNYEA